MFLRNFVSGALKAQAPSTYGRGVAMTVDLTLTFSETHGHGRTCMACSTARAGVARGVRDHLRQRGRQRIHLDAKQGLASKTRVPR